ncbi:MAG: iron-sulfur cluster assembly scaffold protein [Candidatus Niyogibacteria bacterium CG10_big_fil_rev_8_21_14_0_10_42_19]|uniref:Iron-sulfur cluster assembly scaffold protein n=1 Tax=Candidatus Niyogibacteria bacterium CG10_big_fil_rev_8_21_14_0_10_42_19 TaxID=1974725 RepID=A0A2H0TI06_9BACT|nr:MAG: iron-sulfur cluster assembly scaffold protein [Candidatus Niyogibacteria bacterium CG10_big_fil_rev_8_21_14_0_10_42_19]
MKKNIDKKNNGKVSSPDVVNSHTGGSWAYTEKVKSHFFNPQNILLVDPEKETYDAEGIVGSPACGDVMRVWLKIDQAKDKIIDFKWKTFGCASAIAATSILSVMITEKGGMKIDRALKIKPGDIVRRLDGVPDRKIHCSVLSDKALRAALNAWFKKTGQFERVSAEGSKIIDPYVKVTEADIEKAVLGGAFTLKQVQEKTKVGIGYPECIPATEELIRFYCEKHFGK